MKGITKDEFERFDAAMDKILAVSYAELQKKLAEEEGKKKPVKTSSSDRVSPKETEC